MVALKLKSRNFIRDNFLNDVDLKKFLLSNNCLPVKKKKNEYFVGYKDTYKIKPLNAILLKMRQYAKKIYRKFCMSFLIEDDKLPEDIIKSWIDLTTVLK